MSDGRDGMGGEGRGEERRGRLHNHATFSIIEASNAM